MDLNMAANCTCCDVRIIVSMWQVAHMQSSRSHKILRTVVVAHVMLQFWVANLPADTHEVRWNSGISHACCCLTPLRSLDVFQRYWHNGQELMTINETLLLCIRIGQYCVTEMENSFKD